MWESISGLLTTLHTTDKITHLLSSLQSLVYRKALHSREDGPVAPVTSVGIAVLADFRTTNKAV